MIAIQTSEYFNSIHYMFSLKKMEPQIDRFEEVVHIPSYIGVYYVLCQFRRSNDISTYQPERL